MKRNKLLAMLCVIALIAGLVLAGCVGEITPPPAEQEEEEEHEEEPGKVYNLTFGVWDPPEIPMMRVVQASWAKWIERESQGRIKITFLYSETVAKAPELHDATARGLCDMCWTSPGIFAPLRYRCMEITPLPLVFKFPGSLTASLTMYELYQKYQPYFDAEYTDVKIVGFHHNSPSHINTVDKQVRTLEDMKGLIINMLTPEMADALGAVSESIFPGEGYDAIAKGVVDGTLHEYEGHWVWNHYELCNYTTEVGINVMGCFVHVMNLDTYNSLPPELQALFQGDNMKMISYINGYNFDRDDATFKEKIRQYRLDRGNPDGIYVLPDAERQRWVDALMPIRDKWVADVTAKGVPGQEMLDDMLMWSEQFHKAGDELCPWCYDWFVEMGADGYE